MYDQSTPQLGLPLPHPENTLEEDVFRLRAALEAIDSELSGIRDVLFSEDVDMDSVREIVDAVKAAAAGIDAIRSVVDTEIAERFGDLGTHIDAIEASITGILAIIDGLPQTVTAGNDAPLVNASERPAAANWVRAFLAANYLDKTEIERQMDRIIPVGTLQHALTGNDLLPENWRAFDGSVIARDQYPLAAALLGDVKVFDPTPVTTSQTLALADQAQSSTFTNGVNTLVIGDVILIAPTQHRNTSAQSTIKLPVFRSTDVGRGWSVVNIEMQRDTNYDISSVSLQHLGGNNVALVGKAYGYITLAFSSDAGATWKRTYFGQNIKSVSFQLAYDPDISAAAGCLYLIYQYAYSSSDYQLYYCIFEPSTMTKKEGLVGASTEAIALGNAIAARMKADGTHEAVFTYSQRASAVYVYPEVTLSYDGNTVTVLKSDNPFLTLLRSAVGTTGNTVFYESNYRRAGDHYLYLISGKLFKAPLTWDSVSKVCDYNGSLHNFMNGVITDLDTGIYYDVPGDTIGILPGLGKDNTNPIMPQIEVSDHKFAELVTIKSTSPSREAFLGSESFKGIIYTNGSYTATPSYTGPLMLSSPYRMPVFTRTLASGKRKNYVLAVGNVFDATSGEYLEISFKQVSGESEHTVVVNRYAQQEDYEANLQLPWIEGICCKLKE